MLTRVDDRVYSEDGSWSAYHPLNWWERASNGMDVYGCYVYASIDGERIRVQHGQNPEAVRWFTLDELNNVGAPSWVNVLEQWFHEIHMAGVGR